MPWSGSGRAESGPAAGPRRICFHSSSGFSREVWAGNHSRQPGQKPARPPDRNEERQGSHAASGGAQEIKAGADRAAERVGETGGTVRGAMVIPSAQASGDSCGNAGRMGAKRNRQLRVGAAGKSGIDTFS